MEPLNAKIEVHENIKLTEQPLSEVQITDSANELVAEYQQNNDVVESNALNKEHKSSTAAQEKDANYCYSKSSEWKPVRPNFWLPIVAVTSFATPLFMLICIVSIASYLPHLSISSFKHVVHMRGTLAAIVFCLLLSIPSFIGLGTAYQLSKTKIHLLAKLALWWIIAIAACIAWYWAYIALHVAP